MYLLFGLAGLLALGLIWLARLPAERQWQLFCDWQIWRAKARRAAITLSCGRVSYLETSGQGTPVLFVHGFTGMKENWLSLMVAMRGMMPLYAPDLPGWAESERRQDEIYGYRQQADWLAEFIDRVVQQPVDIVGHSMGGGITAVLAARYPEKVRRVVLMSAAGVRYEDNAFGQAVLDGENPFAVSDMPSLRRYLSLVFEHPPWISSTLGHWLIQKRLTDSEFESSVLDSIGRSDDSFLPQTCAEQIRSPCLLLWCKNDRVIDASAATIYAQRIPSTHIVLLEGASHMPMLEYNAATCAALKEFLS